MKWYIYEPTGYEVKANSWSEAEEIVTSHYHGQVDTHELYECDWEDDEELDA